MDILHRTKKESEPDLKVRLSDLEHKVAEDVAKLEIKINNLEKTQGNTGSSIQASDSSRLESRLADLEHLMSNLEVKLLKSGDHPHVETEKLENNAGKPGSIEGDLENILKRINALELQRSIQTPENSSTFEKKINSEKQQAQNALFSSSQNIDQNILKIVEGIRCDIDLLKMKSKSLDTGIVKSESNIKDYLEKINHKVDLKLIDIEEKMDKAFDHVPTKDHYEKNLELRIINMLSEKIEHFAHMLDKKLLEYPMKNEMEKRLVRLEGMISRIEHPNFRPLEERLNNLELKVDHLIRSHEKHSSRIPVVVE